MNFQYSITLSTLSYMAKTLTKFGIPNFSHNYTIHRDYTNDQCLRLPQWWSVYLFSSLHDVENSNIDSGMAVMSSPPLMYDC